MVTSCRCALVNHVGAVSTSAPPNGDPVAKDLVTIPSILGVVSANIVNNTSTSHVNDVPIGQASLVLHYSREIFFFVRLSIDTSIE